MRFHAFSETHTLAPLPLDKTIKRPNTRRSSWAGLVTPKVFLIDIVLLSFLLPLYIASVGSAFAYPPRTAWRWKPAGLVRRTSPTYLCQKGKEEEVFMAGLTATGKPPCCGVGKSLSRFCKESSGIYAKIPVGRNAYKATCSWRLKLRLQAYCKTILFLQIDNPGFRLVAENLRYLLEVEYVGGEALADFVQRVVDELDVVLVEGSLADYSVSLPEVYLRYLPGGCGLGCCPQKFYAFGCAHCGFLHLAMGAPPLLQGRSA